MTKELPKITEAHILMASNILILALLHAESDEVEINQDGFKTPDGETLGDFIIKVKRKKPL